jgi:hypothetical protein
LRIRVNMSAIGSVMLISTVSYQLDLTMPGTWPFRASFLRHIRHNLNFR